MAIAVTVVAAAVLAACGHSRATPRSGAAATSSTASTRATGTAVAATAIPIGDGKVSTSAKAGSVFSCQTSFGGGGATGVGPWIHGSTWDSTAKVHVRGSVAWPQASFSVSVNGDRRTITTNDLPKNEATGTFPVAADDPAFQYDRNPNTIAAQSRTITVPSHPTVAAKPSCVSLGAIGVLNDGVFLFNALDAGGRDAAAHEVLDRCDGHPERSGLYHHHTVPSCMLSTATGASTLVGYALDGFGVYVERHADGSLLTDAELDACHGRTSEVEWDGQRTTLYHYVATVECPYTVGCYRGTPTRS